MMETWLAFYWGGVHSSFVVRLMGSLIG